MRIMAMTIMGGTAMVITDGRHGLARPMNVRGWSDFADRDERAAGAPRARSPFAGMASHNASVRIFQELSP
jgi:hypothetical protein